MAIIDKLFGKIVIHLAYYLSGNLRFKYFKEYKKNLEKSKQDIWAYQIGRLRKLVHHAYSTIPYTQNWQEENQL